MPCQSDYLNAHSDEIEYSRVLLLLDELKTGKHVNTRSREWAGYHNKAYNRGMAGFDESVARLCAKLKKLSPTHLKKHSLELQAWWRDHQIADMERAAEEKKQKENEAARQKALAKLSAREKELLGL